MKDNREDMKVAEKISQLDTLSAGIVYGKEEAWDKLQARMDKKRAVIIPVRYWAAAAAVLMLFVGIAVWYNIPEQEVVVTAKETVRVPEVQQIATVAPQPDAITQEKAVTIKMKQATPVAYHGVQKKMRAEVIVTPPPVVVQEEHSEPTIVSNSPAPVPPAQPMKIIHINDLENGVYNNVPGAGISQAVAMNGLPVVHINEVEREARDVKEILKNNRMTLRIPFSKQNEDYYFNAQDYRQPIQFLKLRTTQN